MELQETTQPEDYKNTVEGITKLKMPSLTASSFMANGKEYFIAESISIERLRRKTRIEIGFGYGASWSSSYETIKAAYNNLRTNNSVVDAAVELYKLLEGLVNVEKGEIASMRMCTLFMNTLGEDIRIYDEAVMSRKIEDFEAEGIDPNFFFKKATVLIQNYIPTYHQHFQDFGKEGTNPGTSGIA